MSKAVYAEHLARSHLQASGKADAHDAPRPGVHHVHHGGVAFRPGKAPCLSSCRGEQRDNLSVASADARAVFFVTAVKWAMQHESLQGHSPQIFWLVRYSADCSLTSDRARTSPSSALPSFSLKFLRQGILPCTASLFLGALERTARTQTSKMLLGKTWKHILSSSHFASPDD